MGAVRIAIIAAAALAAILLAFLVRGMVAPKKPPAPAAAVAAAPPPRPMAQVLVAKHDLSVGARISSMDLAWQPWPVDALNPNFVTDGAAPLPEDPATKHMAQDTARAAKDAVMPSGAMQAFDGAIVKEAMMQGEPVIARKVVRGGHSGYMAVVLSPGMRAMSIPVTAESAAGGFILPGDRVDVVQARAQPDGKVIHSETLMRNVQVLAIDQKTAPDKDARALVGALAVLEVPAADVEVLARGKAMGEMQLVLRSYADLGGSASRGAVDRPVSSSSLRVFRAGQPSEVTVP